MADLAALDAALAERTAFWTLDSAQARAKLPTALCDRVLRSEDSVAFKTSFIDGLVEAARIHSVTRAHTALTTP